MSGIDNRITKEDPGSVFYAAAQTLRRYVSGGNMLFIATVLALVAANLPVVRDFYAGFWEQSVRLQVGEFNVFSHSGRPMTLLEFINDALMAVFFFSIGLEIKREILVGELASFRQALLPIMGAIGGMAVPVIIFLSLSYGSDYADGAAIPMATDIAFSLGVLALLGNRVPVALKIFLTTLAVVDDIGGIVVIAVFYSNHIELAYLLYAFGGFALMLLGSTFGIRTKAFYLTIGAAVWFLFLNSGVHPTIAGVLVAFCVPAKPVYAPKMYIKKMRSAIGRFNSENDEMLTRRTILTNDQMDWLKQVESASDKVISPLQDLEDSLHPIVNMLIVPLFAFANAGIFLLDLEASSIVGGISLAIILSLVIGKSIGILGMSWLTVKLHLAPMPDGCNWKTMASTAVLCGIGFTVSLFIAGLTFGSGSPSDIELLNEAKLGIVVGSLLAGLCGFLLLHHFLPKRAVKPAD